MYKKRLIALCVTLLLVVSSVVSVGAASFPDIASRHSWATEAIDSMVSRGILKGYTDGTFKPDKPVTHLETLIIASRIMGVDNEENAEYRKAAVKEHTKDLSAYNISYKDEVAYLMYWNVLSREDLSDYISDVAKDKPLKRYEAAVLLTKLVGGEKAALDNSVIVLDFKDSSDIPSSAKAYVKYVFDSKLMNGVDDESFAPNGELTRAMIATIMYRAENNMDMSVVDGTVSAVNSSSIIVSVNGKTQEIAVPENILIKSDARVIDIGSIEEGSVIRAHYQGNSIRFIDLVSSNTYKSISGIISNISESNGIKRVSIKTTTGMQSYPINSSRCVYKVDNEIKTYTDIKTNMYAVLSVQGGEITSILVETGSKTVTGKLSDISIGEEAIVIKGQTNKGEDFEYMFNEGALIYRNNSASEFRNLSIGDSVTITITNGGISKLIASSASYSVKGTISRIVISPSSSVTIKTSTEETEYFVTSSTSFVVDGQKDCSIYDLRLGATADVRLDSTNIMSISTNSTVATPTLTGVVTYTHPTNYVMGLQVTNAATGEVETVQTVVKSSVKITDTTSARISSFKQITPGMTVVVVGTSSYGVYEVNQIIVTAVVDKQ